MPIMEQQVWMHTPQETVLYVATAGEASDYFTNYLSTVRFEVVVGAGFIATSGMQAEVEESSIVSIAHSTSYQYGGNMEVLISIKPGLASILVSRNGEKLPRKGRRLHRQLERSRRWDYMHTILTGYGEQALLLLPLLEEE